MIAQLMLTGYEGTRRQDYHQDLAWPSTNGQILHRPAKMDMTHQDQRVRLLRFISSMVRERDDGYGVLTIKGKRWGEKVLLPRMDREWTEDLLQY